MLSEKRNRIENIKGSSTDVHTTGTINEVLIIVQEYKESRHAYSNATGDIRRLNVP